MSRIPSRIPPRRGDDQRAREIHKQLAAGEYDVDSKLKKDLGKFVEQEPEIKRAAEERVKWKSQLDHGEDWKNRE